MRLLGVDFGFKRIGLAVGESDHGIVSTRPTIQASGTLRKDAETLAAKLKDEGAEAIVLGLPVGDEGEEGKMVRIVRQLAGHLEDLGVVIHLIDESLTSVEAEREMALQGLKASRRRKLRDGEAAKLILERYIDAKGSHH